MIDQNSLRNIEEVHRLKTQGIISPTDFEEGKARLLSAGGAHAPAGQVPTPKRDDFWAGWSCR